MGSENHLRKTRNQFAEQLRHMGRIGRTNRITQRNIAEAISCHPLCPARCIFRTVGVAVWISKTHAEVYHAFFSGFCCQVADAQQALYSFFAGGIGVPQLESFRNRERKTEKLHLGKRKSLFCTPLIGHDHQQTVPIAFCSGGLQYLRCIGQLWYSSGRNEASAIERMKTAIEQSPQVFNLLFCRHMIRQPLHSVTRTLYNLHLPFPLSHRKSKKYCETFLYK